MTEIGPGVPSPFHDFYWMAATKVVALSRLQQFCFAAWPQGGRTPSTEDVPKRPRGVYRGQRSELPGAGAPEWN